MSQAAIPFDTAPAPSRDRALNVKRQHLPPRLADTIPPTEPPAPVLLAQPKAHRLIAWRNGPGGLRETKHETLELAREAAAALHYAAFYKFAIMCGREMVARALIEEPR
jgi:hypothetical protein